VCRFISDSLVAPHRGTGVPTERKRKQGTTRKESS
jgi:hypothetical protein